MRTRSTPRVTRAPERGSGDISARRVNVPDYQAELDPVIHERRRLGIVNALAINASLTFTELKRMLSLTDGNLSMHARRLEEVGYIDCEKTLDGRAVRTYYRLTPAGHRALARYLDNLERLIRTVRASLKAGG
jgi:DNA-binding MarR family transcriptional regulator